MIKLMKSTFFREAETKAALLRFIAKTRTLSMGVETEKFERRFAEKQGRRFAVFVNSGSSANLVLLQALLNLGMLRRGSRVGISALTWATNVMPVLQLGMEPVAIDCEIDTLNISPKSFRERINGLDALFLTNVLGFADDLPKIAALCKRRKILLLEDNCEALGSKIGGKLLGNFGLASTFSFFVGHHLSTVEGGMIATDDETLYHELVMVRAHGWDRNLPVQKQNELRGRHAVDPFFARYSFYTLGYNVRPTDMQGFMGTAQLKYLPQMVRKRQAQFRSFAALMDRHSDLLPVRHQHMDVISCFAIPVIAKSPEIFKELVARFERAGVEVRPIIAGDISKQPFYRKHVKQSDPNPNAEYIHRHAFYFTNDPALSADERTYISELLREEKKTA